MSVQNVIAVSFAERSAAYEAFSNLTELDRQGQQEIRAEQKQKLEELHAKL